MGHKSQLFINFDNKKFLTFTVRNKSLRNMLNSNGPSMEL